MHRPDHRRAGMTLVELLVVVAIIGLLAVTVLPNLSSTAETRRTRETARAVSTWVSKAQSRAIGRTEWAGFWILPVNSNAPYAAAIDLQLADVPEVYRGESLQSQVMVRATSNPPAQLVAWTNFYRELHQPGVPSQQAPFVTDIAIQASSRTLQTGDLIRFDGCGVWFELFQYTTTPQQAFGVRFRERGLKPEDALSVQNSLNTPWPLEAVPHSYEVLRQPARSGATFSFGDGRCIDLYWSGRQQDSAFKWFGSATQAAKPVGVLFDATGRVRELVVNNTRESVEGAIYLLVGRADRAGQREVATLNANDDSVGANWQYGDSYWIAIDPNSGMAKVAEVAINAANKDGDVIGSQSFIRSQLVTGGR